MRALELKYDKEHFARLDAIYVKKIEQLYLSAIREATNIAGTLGSGVDTSKPFSFSDYPQTRQRVDKLFNTLEFNINSTLNEATEKEWIAAAKKNDDLVDHVLRSTAFTRDQVEHLYNRNLESLAAFQKRKEGGLRLSDKVWKYTNQFKGDIEMGLDVGISDGRSAANLSRDLRKYLQEPDRLFRRVRDLRGDLVLSQNAKKYNPGPGVYRSSYKNVLRLTRSEVNMAYRTSDFERWQQLDFVVGIEVHRSNHVFACTTCDTLQGRYPKNFKFRGWHPACRCYVITILSTIEEFVEREKRRMAGEDVGEMHSVNEVKDVTGSYKKWIGDNQEKLDLAKNKPYFITDNLLYSGKKNMDSEVMTLMDRAKESGPEVESIAGSYANRFGGYVSPINYKSQESITRKLTDELNGNIDEIKDTVRNTIVISKDQIEWAIRTIIEEKKFVRVKRQFAEKDLLGYSGTIANIKAKNGIIAEVQINTDKMIYAKEKKSNAVRIIGQKRWDEIHEETGLDGGLGHEYYEKWRKLPRDSKGAQKLAEKSIEYYSHFIY